MKQRFFLTYVTLNIFKLFMQLKISPLNTLRKFWRNLKQEVDERLISQQNLRNAQDKSSWDNRQPPLEGVSVVV